VERITGRGRGDGGDDSGDGEAWGGRRGDGMEMEGVEDGGS
jgi:hypothetical protein